MMSRKSAVDDFVQQHVPAGQAGGQLTDNLAGSAVPGIPGDGQRAAAVIIARQPCDVFIADRMLGDLTTDLMRISEAKRDLTQLEDLCSVNRLAAKHQLEAVVVRRVVGSGHHDTAIDAES